MPSSSVTVTAQDAAEVNLLGDNTQRGIQTNFDYFRTIPGLLKIAQLVLGLICLIVGSDENDAGDWFVFVTKTAFVITLIWSFIYFFYIRESSKIQIKYWIGLEILTTALFPWLLFTAFIGDFVWAFRPLYFLAGLFGLVDAIAYGAGTTFLVLDYLNEPIPAPSDLLPT